MGVYACDRIGTRRRRRAASGATPITSRVDSSLGSALADDCRAAVLKEFSVNCFTHFQRIPCAILLSDGVSAGHGRKRIELAPVLIGNARQE
jgi:hypothetical protein